MECYSISLYVGYMKENNRQTCEGVDNDTVKLNKSSLLCLISLWCAYEVPFCIEDWISFLESHTFLKVSVLFDV